MNMAKSGAGGQHRTDGKRVQEFTRNMGFVLPSGEPIYRRTDRILGFTSFGKAARRWLEAGIPPYVATLMDYVETFGPELAEELALKRDAIVKAAEAKMPGKKWYIKAAKTDQFRVEGAIVFEWRNRHGLSQPMMDRMFGSTSRGRSCRLWETTAAPPYVEFFLAYAERYGMEFAFERVEERGQSIPTTARGVC